MKRKSSKLSARVWILLAVLASPAWPQRAEEPPRAASPVDARTAEMLRAWLADAPLPAGSAGEASSPAVKSEQLWRRYIEIVTAAPRGEQEDGLRRLYREADSDALRGTILRAISEDPAFQTRQADFIRRYGFYANWFNRLIYSAEHAIQGNIQSVLQLGVDAVNDLFTPGEADARTRRAYQLLERAEAEGAATRGSREKLDRLRQRVDKALAAADYERANWAMLHGDPDAAAFYAAQAEIFRPGWSRAESLRRDAEAGAAARRRRALASEQMGYPDRQPPVKLAAPEAVRGALMGEPLPTASDALMASFLDHLEERREGTAFRGRATMMREWPKILEGNRRAPEPQQRWLASLMNSAEHNADLRLATARSRRRGQVMRYIFVGPESGRQQAYKAASWTAQTFQALQNVGIFYVFEVMGRGVKAAFSPPTPDDEYLDAQMTWLRQAPRPFNAEAKRLAADLAEFYRKHQRFDDARRVLTATNQFSPRHAERINKAEVNTLIDHMERQSDPAVRKVLLERAQAISPAAAARAPKPRTEKAERREWEVSWDNIQLYAQSALPAGLPGQPAWFDGRTENGEISSQPVAFEETATSGTLRMAYEVRFPGERRIFEARLRPAELPEALRRWLELSSRQQTAAQAAIEKLDRLPIPFALEGGAGASGVDFYPRLKPLEDPTAQLQLYSE